MGNYGVVGLGRMGGGMVRNLLRSGIRPVAYDRNPEAMREFEAEGVVVVQDVADLPARLDRPRVIWMMVPAGEAVDQVIAALRPGLEKGDVLIDGGNSHYRDSMRRAAALEAEGAHYLDCGSSGGMEGALNGMCLMVGGNTEAFTLARPLLEAISQPGGLAHVGPSGAGHYVKMVHNAIEYGMLQAIGEGFELIEAAPFDLDKVQIANLWNHGSVIRSWLIELAARAFAKDPHLEGLHGHVGGGSTGSWAVREAWERGVPFTTIATAFSARLRSRQEDSFAAKVVSALRWEFGGHEARWK